RQLPGPSIIGSNETAHSVVAARGSYDDLSVDCQRSAGRAIVLVPIGERHIPNKVSGAEVEAKQVGVIGVHVHARMPNGYSAVMVARCVIDQTFRLWHGVMPNLPSGACVERVGIIR